VVAASEFRPENDEMQMDIEYQDFKLVYSEERKKYLGGQELQRRHDGTYSKNRTVRR
jgi:hypothetical protein